MKFLVGILVFIDLLFLFCCLAMPRSGMEAMGTMFILIPLAGLHLLLGTVFSIVSLRKKEWHLAVYFVVATYLMINIYQLYAELKPTYRLLHKVLATRAKIKGRELIVYKSHKILGFRRLVERFQDPAHAELCSSLEYPLVLENVSSALQQKPSLSKPCALLHGRKSLPILALLQESYEPWIRERSPKREEQLGRINSALSLLLANGADPNVRDEKGNTPLLRAVWYNDIQLVSTLLDNNSCVYLENDEKRSVLNSTRTSDVREIIMKAAEDPAMVENCPQFQKKQEVLSPEDEAEYDETKRGKELLYGVTNGRLDIVTRNVAKGVDVNSRDKKGRSPLHLATRCKKEMPAIIEILMRAGADINSRDRYDNTPLMASVENHCPQTMAILLAKGAEVSLANRQGSTALHLMARWNAEKISPSIGLLLEAGIAIDVRDDLGRTPAMMTKYVRLTGDNALKVFLLKGADPNLADRHGNTLLHKFASDSSTSERVTGVSYLIEAGADLDIRNKDGLTPLMLAVKRRKIEITRLLLEHGASPNVKTSRGTPLLHSVVSCKEESKKFLEFFVKAGADVNLTDSSGRTPLHKAFLGHLHVTCLDPIGRLLQEGAKLNMVDNNGVAPLHNLAYWEMKSPAEAIDLVKQYGGDIDIRDGQGMTTLLLSARFGNNAGVTRAFLEAGANPQAVDKKGNSILHCVAMNQKESHLRQLEAILPVAGDLNLKNKAGMTPLHIANKYGNETMELKLLEMQR